MDVSVRELKNRLSEYLRRAQSGEEIIVTSHSKPVGRLLGPPPSSADSPEESLSHLRAQSWIRPGEGGKVLGSEKPVEWPEGEQPLSRLLLEDRD